MSKGGNQGTTRREVLKVGAGATLGSLLAGPTALARWLGPLRDDADEKRRVLVVLQLSGGNDGLSTVIPFEDPAYARARPKLAMRDEDLLELDEGLAFAPEWADLHARFGEGRLAVVQGVGYDPPNRSHFESLDIWHAADLRGRRAGTGWLGRLADLLGKGERNPNLVVVIGRRDPFSVAAEEQRAVSFLTAETYRWSGAPSEEAPFEKLNRREGEEGRGAGVLSFLRQVARDALDSSEAIRRAVGGYRPSVQYPRDALGLSLRNAAALIDSPLGVRILHVETSGFDTHAQQPGRHRDLRRQVDRALAAFQADLDAKGHDARVSTLVFSEFGRRVAENASGGTDHGTAAPVFLLGTGVAGGLHGRHPDLEDLERGDLKPTVDFRSVYQSIVSDWMGQDAARVLGGRHDKLHLFV